MFIFAIIVHVTVSLVLIAVILLQAGRGDMSNTFGGGAATKLLGTGAASFLSRATTVCAVIFMLTSLLLAVLSSSATRSLMDRARNAPASAAPAQTQEKQKDETPKAE